MSTPKNARILGIRLDAAEADILQQIEATTNITPVSLVRAALKAVLLRWQQHKELVVPFHLVTSSELAKMNASKQEPLTVNLGPLAKAPADLPSNIMQLTKQPTPSQPQAQKASPTSGTRRKKSG